MATTIADHDIARWRLRGQRLVQPHADAATDVVDTLLAVQAENPRQSEWAVASRTRAPSQSEIRALLDDGRLIRTHVLRPTWHYVLAEDLGWLLDLTAPRVRPTIARQLRRVHGLDGRGLARATSVVLDTLAHGRHCTRRRIAEALHASGFDDGGQFVMILLAHLELEQLICSGRADGGVHTYALLSERVPSTRRLDREEALGELALRYFMGHGPATDRDLAYWATLTVTDVRRGLERARDRLDSLEHDGRTYWHALGEVAPRRQARPVGHLLQILDEVYRGYQDSRWALDTAGIVPRHREAAIGIALVDAQLAAAMRRTLTTTTVVFELAPYRRLARPELDALQQAAERYGAYLGLEPRLVLS